MKRLLRELKEQVMKRLAIVLVAILVFVPVLIWGAFNAAGWVPMMVSDANNAHETLEQKREKLHLLLLKAQKELNAKIDFVAGNYWQDKAKTTRRIFFDSHADIQEARKKGASSRAINQLIQICIARREDANAARLQKSPRARVFQGYCR